jgi:hypothetical protein
MNKAALFAITFLFLLSCTLSAQACSPSRGDPWYTFELEVDPSTLPFGVSLSKDALLTTASDEPIYIFQRSLDIESQREVVDNAHRANPDSSIQFGYLEVLPYETFDEAYARQYPDTGLPPHYLPLYKIENSGLYFYVKNSGWMREKMNGLSIASYLSNVRSIPIGDDRSSDANTPSPQDFEFVVFTDGNEQTIKGKIVYSLNEDYDPKASEKGIEACERFMKNQRKQGLWKRFLGWLFGGGSNVAQSRQSSQTALDSKQ